MSTKTGAADPLTGFLAAYASALSSGDLAAVAACWEVPALVLSDAGAIAVSREDEIIGFFRSAVEWYRQNGMHSTRALEISPRPLSERLTAVELTWASYDAEGAERSRERSYYVLRADDSGALRIRLAAGLPAPR